MAKINALLACPPYPGGKRKLLGNIFRCIPPPEQAPRLVDAFLGGGTVSLFAKHRGYQVACNDIAMRSYIIGKSLIENDFLTLHGSDLQALCDRNSEAGTFIVDNFAPGTFITRHAQFLDSAFANLTRYSVERQWPIKLILLHFMFKTRVMGNWGAKRINEQIDAGNWDEINDSFIREAASRRLNHHPMVALDGIMRVINRAICYNGHHHTASQLDVFDFVAQTDGDIVFLDPPYPATASYEQSFRVVDSVLAGHVVDPDVSGFSHKDALGLLDNLLEATRKYPTLVLTYGNKVVALPELLKLVRRHRPTAGGTELAYIHQTGLAGKESRESNRELIIWDTPHSTMNDLAKGGRS